MVTHVVHAERLRRVHKPKNRNRITGQLKTEPAINPPTFRNHYDCAIQQQLAVQSFYQPFYHPQVFPQSFIPPYAQAPLQPLKPPPQLPIYQQHDEHIPTKLPSKSVDTYKQQQEALINKIDQLEKRQIEIERRAIQAEEMLKQQELKEKWVQLQKKHENEQQQIVKNRSVIQHTKTEEEKSKQSANIGFSSKSIVLTPSNTEINQAFAYMKKLQLPLEISVTTEDASSESKSTSFSDKRRIKIMERHDMTHQWEVIEQDGAVNPATERVPGRINNEIKLPSNSGVRNMNTYNDKNEIRQIIPFSNECSYRNRDIRQNEFEIEQGNKLSYTLEYDQVKLPLLSYPPQNKEPFKLEVPKSPLTCYKYGVLSDSNTKYEVLKMHGIKKSPLQQMQKDSIESNLRLNMHSKHQKDGFYNPPYSKALLKHTGHSVRRYDISLNQTEDTTIDENYAFQPEKVHHEMTHKEIISDSTSRRISNITGNISTFDKGDYVEHISSSTIVPQKSEWNYPIKKSRSSSKLGITSIEKMPKKKICGC